MGRGATFERQRNLLPLAWLDRDYSAEKITNAHHTHFYGCAGNAVSGRPGGRGGIRNCEPADLVFAEHDGVKLVGDLYLPKGRRKAPVLVAVHGGGWQIGAPRFYRNWGLFLARNGYAVFAIEYRLAKARALSRCGL